MRDSTKILKAVNAGVVSVSPARLNGIAADDLKSGKLKAVVRVTHVRPQNVAEHVRLAAARRARTRASQKLQIQKRFIAVIPLDRQLVSNLLDICRLKAHADLQFTTMSIFRAIPGLLALRPRSFAENRGPDADESCALFNRNRVILRHPNRKLRKIDMELGLHPVAQLTK